MTAEEALELHILMQKIGDDIYKAKINHNSEAYCVIVDMYENLVMKINVIRKKEKVIE